MKPWPEFLRDNPKAREWLFKYGWESSPHGISLHKHPAPSDRERWYPSDLRQYIQPYECLALIEKLVWQWEDYSYELLRVFKPGGAIIPFSGDTRHHAALQYCLEEEFGEPE